MRKIAFPLLLLRSQSLPAKEREKKRKDTTDIGTFWQFPAARIPLIGEIQPAAKIHH
jgi:hypothetical protein